MQQSLDLILEEAVREFQAEQDLENVPETSLEDMERLVDNLRDPAFSDTLRATLQALSGNKAGNETLRGVTPAPSLDRTMAKTMELLATHGDSAQAADTGEQLMTNMIAEFEKFGQKEDLDQCMDNMMRQLLARDLMYEPMKLVCDKYPEWLADNAPTLSRDDYMQYGTQYQYIQRIVAVYETEPDNFARLVELLHDLQEYGQPPADIVKHLAPGLHFSEDGMPIMNVAGDNFFPKANAMPGMPGIPAGFPVPDPASQACLLM